MNGNGPVDPAALGGGVNGFGAAGAGNARLNEAFDYAIREANQTLTITTKKGADLYALKQRPS